MVKAKTTQKTTPKTTVGTRRRTGSKVPAKTGKKTVTKTAGKSPRQSAGKTAAPLADIGRILEKFKLPGVDVKAIVAGQRKDVQAVTLANKQAYEGMKALARRQSEMVKEAIAEWRAAVKDLVGTDRSELAAKRTELARQVFGKALANMRELAEMAVQSQTQAWDTVSKRFQENLADLKKALLAK